MWLFGCLSGAEVFNRVSKYIQELYFFIIYKGCFASRKRADAGYIYNSLKKHNYKILFIILMLSRKRALRINIGILRIFINIDLFIKILY